MKTELYWVPVAASGRLAILARPRGNDWLADEVTAWRSEGIDAVVSLLTVAESDELGLGNESDLCEATGIGFHSFPVEDRDVPESRTAFGELADRMATLVAAGRTVGVHCRQGIGRSGLLAIAVTNRLGVAPARGIEIVSAARGRPVPETPVQHEWLLRHLA